MRTDASKIGLRAIRNVLDGAKPFELEVSGKKISCAVSRGEPEAWPDNGVEGLDPATDGPMWPTSIVVDCRWEGGACGLLVSARYNRGKGRYRHHVAFRVRVRESRRMIIWTNIALAIGDAPDGTKVKVVLAASTFKRKTDDGSDLGERLNQALKDLVQESGLPLISAATAEACEIEVPTGAVYPSGEVAFRRLVHLALLKIDFVDRGKNAKARGTPIVDPKRWGVSPDQIADLDEDTDEDVEEPPVAAGARRYWCGGFGDPARRDQFLAESYWQIGWSRDAKEKPARRTWRRFAAVQPGDLFAIKGYGGSHDLVVHYVGEVVAIDAEKGRVDLKRLDVPLFKGKAPRGGGAGAWFDTLVPVTRADVIDALFSVKPRDPASLSQTLRHDDPRLNLIFYGPPGTGKTFRMRDLQKGFIRRVEGNASAVADVAGTLKWYQAIALAIHANNGTATVDRIIEHPVLKAKYAAQAIPTPLRQIVWGTLGQHAIESSKTVKMKRRFGELLFDKREDGAWILAEKLPEDLAVAAMDLRSQGGPAVSQDFSFVTFHQSYAYEDFIEGIRPEVSGPDEDSSLSYKLDDGVFKHAVRAALRLAGHDGTIDEFCRLPQEDRQRLLEDAPPYAVFIDEINRGNVARIFGELITLLEPDKRLGADQELIVDLPHSRTKFGVPSNLYVFGTMNTADRSVEALDAALRRRFDFEELPPLPELLQGVEVEGVRVDELLRVINQRLEKLYDRDHRIGHAYLLSLEEDDSLENLKRIFRDRILPLLQEYFFGDWGKIGLILGKEFVIRHDPSAIEFADFDHEEQDAMRDRPSWELVNMDKVTNHSFRRIYERVEEA